MAKSAKQRKEEQRKREEQRLIDIGAERFEEDFGYGTCEALDRIVQAGDFEHRKEALVHMIHTVDNLIIRDSHVFEQIIDVRNLRKSK